MAQLRLPPFLILLGAVAPFPSWLPFCDGPFLVCECAQLRRGQPLPLVQVEARSLLLLLPVPPVLADASLAVL